jgi:hypothetical protein
MHLKLFAAAGVAALMLFTPARADAACCDQKMMSCCEKEVMPCCADKDAVQVLLALAPLQSDPQLNPATPARQLTSIWFKQPVRFGNKILQGHYVIEHDNDRMARGEPCTHIYAFDDRTTPVVTFHCTHIERGRTTENIAVLATKGDYKVMTEFQFAGETAAHGVPTPIR